MSKFKTILADPPWPYNSPNAVIGNGGRGYQDGHCKEVKQVNVLQHYQTMTIEDIKALPVKSVTDKNAHLYLWTTNGFLVEAHEIAKSWGFKPKTLITWVKTKKNEPKTPSMGSGYWYRGATEHILFGVRGVQRLTGTVPNVYFHPRLGHSIKPDIFYDLIEKQSPGPYFELFARRLRNGWDSWGDEIASTLDFNNK